MKVKKTYEGLENLWGLRKLILINETYESWENYEG